MRSYLGSKCSLSKEVSISEFIVRKSAQARTKVFVVALLGTKLNFAQLLSQTQCTLDNILWRRICINFMFVAGTQSRAQLYHKVKKETWRLTSKVRLTFTGYIGFVESWVVN